MYRKRRMVEAVLGYPGVRGLGKEQPLEECLLSDRGLWHIRAVKAPLGLILPAESAAMRVRTVAEWRRQEPMQSGTARRQRRFASLQDLFEQQLLIQAVNQLHGRESRLACERRRQAGEPPDQVGTDQDLDHLDD